jgi:hypothetical protein
MSRTPRSPKAGRPPRAEPKSRAKTPLRRDTTLIQSAVPRRVESRLAPPRYAERRHAKPGAGIKRSRAVMTPRPRRRAGTE